MTNLLNETREAISESGHNIKDIVFIGSLETGHACTWKRFCILADVNYDAGYGSAEVASDLVVVFSDGSKLWRHEYDGSEHWMFDAPVSLPQDASKPIKRLVGRFCPTLAQLQDDTDALHLSRADAATGT
jgi:hypothetical protein